MTLHISSSWNKTCSISFGTKFVPNLVGSKLVLNLVGTNLVPNCIGTKVVPNLVEFCWNKICPKSYCLLYKNVNKLFHQISRLQIFYFIIHSKLAVDRNLWHNCKNTSLLVCLKKNLKNLFKFRISYGLSSQSRPKPWF